MHNAGRSRSALRVALVMGCLLLAFAVFAWGLHAKLSLYEAHATPSSATVAKLLITQKTGRDLVASPNSPSFQFRELAFALLATLILLPILSLLWLTPDAFYGWWHKDPSTPAIFSRPPPLTLRTPAL